MWTELVAMGVGSLVTLVVSLASSGHLKLEVQRLSRQNELLVSTILYKEGDVSAAAVLQTQSAEAMLAASPQAGRADGLSANLMGLS